MADGYAGLSSPTLVWESGTIDFNTAAIKATWVAPFKCVVLRAFFVCLDNSTDTNTVTMSVDSVAAGTSTSTSAGFGQLNKPNASTESKYVYLEPTTQKVYVPGDQLMFNVTTEGVGATPAVVGLLFREIPEVIGNHAAALAAV